MEWFSTLIWCRITVIFGNSQQQFTVTDGGCKEYTSKYRKMATETLRRKRRQQHEQWNQALDQLQHEQQVKQQQHAPHAHHLSMNAERALLYTLSSCLTPHWLKIWVLSFHLHSHPWAHFLASLLLFYFHLSLSSSFLPPPALRAVHWARQPDRHGKLVLLRQQGEWRRLRRLHLPRNLFNEIYNKTKPTTRLVRRHMGNVELFELIVRDKP